MARPSWPVTAHWLLELAVARHDIAERSPDSAAPLHA